MLYQRYFLRMNQNNMMHVLGLLLAVAASLLAVQGHSLYLAHRLQHERQTAFDDAPLFIASTTGTPVTRFVACTRLTLTTSYRI